MDFNKVSFNKHIQYCFGIVTLFTRYQLIRIFDIIDAKWDGNVDWNFDIEKTTNKKESFTTINTYNI